MGRRRRLLDFSEDPFSFSVEVLGAETEIKRAVKEWKTETTFLQASNIGGGTKCGKISDRTSAAVIRRNTTPPVVTLEDGRKLEAPEKWLRVLSSVRRAASRMKGAWPEWLRDEWQYHFIDGGQTWEDREGFRPDPTTCSIRAWIIGNVMQKAAALKLIRPGREIADIIKDHYGESGVNGFMDGVLFIPGKHLSLCGAAS
jgi:hypothetical protein